MLLTPKFIKAQENFINLNFLFDKWDIVQDDIGNNDLILIRSKVNTAYSYNFEKRRDSIIYQNKVLERRIGYLGIPKAVERREEEVWSLDSQKAMLRYDIYFDSIVSEKPADYSIIYKIVSLDKKYLKLRLETELFEGKNERY